MNLRIPLAILLLVFPAVACQGAALVAAQPAAGGQIVGTEITDKQRAAVEKGLEWLARQQAPGGHYGNYGGTGGHAGITALAGVAFMSAGNLPGRGRYGEQVEKITRYVASCCQESGLISSENTQGVMYGHGFATLFLAEVYGMSSQGAALLASNEDLKEKLRKAVGLIERVQNSEGGWRYQPAPQDADISVTICQVMALRAARDAGLKVNKAVIDRAIGYVRRCQNADGGFSYQAGQGSGSGYARTAAGVATLYYAGIFSGNELQRGQDYLKQFIGGGRGGEGDSYFFYGNYYAAQAMFLAGGDYWARYYPWIREDLIRRQGPDGSWSGGEGGIHYSTAMALIILQMPNRYLPVFHGKGLEQ